MGARCSGLRTATRYGWHKGDYFLKRIQRTIQRKTGNPRSTFADLRADRFRELHVIGDNLCTHQARAFPDEHSQNMAVADAVRISMSIPLVFASRELDSETYVDGGVLWNYPITIFD